MAGVITTGNHPKDLWPGIAAHWGRVYDEHPEEFSQIFDVMGSTKNYEEDVEITGFGLAPVKNQGASTQYDSETQGFVKRYTNVAYSLGYIVTREERDDNLYTEVSTTRTGALAFSFRQTKEIVHANIFNRAFDSNYVGGDSTELIATTHPTKSGNQSNYLATPADLSEASLEDLCIQIMKARNAKDLRIGLRPRCLLVPPDYFFEANRILNSVLQNDTANNAINVLRAEGVIPEGIKTNHYLTDVDAWFVRTTAPRGTISFQRVPIEFGMDNDFDTDNAKAKAYERYVPGWTDWRQWYGSEGA